MALVYVRAFREDVIAAVAWLENEHPAWLAQFQAELEELEVILEAYPGVGVPIEAAGRTARKFFFRRAPYIVWYDQPEPGVVRMLRLFHGHARRPAERRPRRKHRH